MAPNTSTKAVLTGTGLLHPGFLCVLKPLAFYFFLNYLYFDAFSKVTW